MQLAAYSPTGPTGSPSLAPSDATGTSGYTLPEDSATMRALRYRSAIDAVTTTLVIQVTAGSSPVPNFWPTKQITLGASGSDASDARSDRSARTTVTPACAMPSRTACELKRETATMRR